MTMQRLLGILVVTQTLLLGVIAWQLRDVSLLRQTVLMMSAEQMMHGQILTTQLRHAYAQLHTQRAWLETLPGQTPSPWQPPAWLRRAPEPPKETP